MDKNILVAKIHKADLLHTKLLERIHRENDPHKCAHQRHLLEIIDQHLHNLHEFRRKMII